MAEGIFIPDMVEVDDGGVAADHAPALTLPVQAAPFTEAEKPNFNALRRSLTTVACKDVPGSHYEFDSSVLNPLSQKGFIKLKGIIDRHPGSPLSIFGHADEEGSPEYNKFLSERRAEAVFAMLIRDVPTWERLFSDQTGARGDVWGDPAIEIMLGALGFNFATDKPETLDDVIRRFQVARSLAPTGKNTKAFRAELFAEYMDFLCSDAKGKPFSLQKTDFLGEGAKHGAFQGCSFFNPQLVLAGSEEKAFRQDKTNGEDQRREANFDNRRTIIYFFEKDSKIDPAKWPCPRASEGIGKCVAHFWSDGNDRKGKHIDEKRRRFGKAVRDHTERIAQIEKTFACRFYHGLALHSPCEGDLQMWVVQLMVDAPHEKGKNVQLKPLANTKYVVTTSSNKEAPVIRGTTNVNGVIGIPMWERVAGMSLKLDVFSAIAGAPLVDPNKKQDPNAPKVVQSIDIEVPDIAADDDLTDPFKNEKSFVTFPMFGGNLKRVLRKFDPPTIDPNTKPPADLEPDAGEPPVQQDEQSAGARQRLFNLGYGVEQPLTWTDAQLAQFVKRYQKDKKLTQSAKLDTDTVASIRKEYGS